MIRKRTKPVEIHLAVNLRLSQSVGETKLCEFIKRCIHNTGGQIDEEIVQILDFASIKVFVLSKTTFNQPQTKSAQGH